MSTRYEVSVVCDSCGNWIGPVFDYKRDGLASKAVALAKKNGWSRVTNAVYQDLCPGCLKLKLVETPCSTAPST